MPLTTRLSRPKRLKLPHHHLADRANGGTLGANNTVREQLELLKSVCAMVESPSGSCNKLKGQLTVFSVAIFISDPC